MHFTDSQVALSWISNEQLRLKQWTRNRVIEINRLTDKNEWKYIESKNMMADFGTRRGAKLEDVLDESSWVCGFEWASLEREKFPVKSFQDIKLDSDDLQTHDEELIKLNVADSKWITAQLSQHCQSYLTFNEKETSEINKRYEFSDYVLDPNKFRFKKVVKILALIKMFVNKLKAKIGKSSAVTVSQNSVPDQLSLGRDAYLVTQGNGKFPFTSPPGLVVHLPLENIVQSLNYFYEKATDELKHFYKKGYFEKISEERFGILYYTGRILPAQNIENKLQLSDVCIDLSNSSFCVPLIDKHSPLAYAIINEVHWYSHDARHSGNETVLRHVQKIAFIPEGKPLIKKFRIDCS